MDSIRIDTGIKRIAINDDPTRIIEFNPTDLAFVERFYSIIREFDAKQAEYQRRSDAIDKLEGLDAHGIPLNLDQGLSLLREACEFMRGKIDEVFGAGTSQIAFGNALTLDMFRQFFDGIVPFVKSARDAKTLRYLNSELSGRVMK